MSSQHLIHLAKEKANSLMNRGAGSHRAPGDFALSKKKKSLPICEGIGIVRERVDHGSFPIVTVVFTVLTGGAADH